jgi:hypothetical protein
MIAGATITTQLPANAVLFALGKLGAFFVSLESLTIEQPDAYHSQLRTTDYICSL